MGNYSDYENPSAEYVHITHINQPRIDLENNLQKCQIGIENDDDGGLGFKDKDGAYKSIREFIGTPHRLVICDSNGRLSSSLIRKNGLLYELLDSDGYGYLAFGQDADGKNIAARSEGYVRPLVDQLETDTPGVYHDIITRQRGWVLNSETGLYESVYRVTIDGRLSVLDVPSGDGTVALVDASGNVVTGNLHNEGDVTVADGPLRVVNVPDISGAEIGSVGLLDENGNLRRGAIYQSSTGLQIVDNNGAVVLSVDLTTGYSTFYQRFFAPNLDEYFNVDNVMSVISGGRVVKTKRVREWEVVDRLTVGDDPGTPGMQANILDANSTDIQLKKPARLLSVATAETANTVLTRVGDEVQEVPTDNIKTPANVDGTTIIGAGTSEDPHSIGEIATSRVTGLDTDLALIDTELDNHTTAINNNSTAISGLNSELANKIETVLTDGFTILGDGVNTPLCFLARIDTDAESGVDSGNIIDGETSDSEYDYVLEGNTV